MRDIAATTGADLPETSLNLTTGFKLSDEHPNTDAYVRKAALGSRSGKCAAPRYTRPLWKTRRQPERDVNQARKILMPPTVVRIARTANNKKIIQRTQSWRVKHRSDRAVRLADGSSELDIPPMPVMKVGMEMAMTSV